MYFNNQCNNKFIHVNDIKNWQNGAHDGFNEVFKSFNYIYINMQYFTATHFNPHSNDDYNNNMKIHSCVIQ